MSSEPLVRLGGVSKCYQTYAKPYQRLIQPYVARHLYQEFWALRGIDLEVRGGEAVGIVGRNGSGKSTLLQIIAGTLHATEGRVETRGRVSALLELGAGFNPEFTGYENARLNAAIMGIGAEQFEQLLPEIVAFSELGEFMHRPVRIYSSGMYVRLAFGVAIHMRPDILIVDEALAVGDIRFQRKCFRRIAELRAQGVAVLFVSHATQTVLELCDRALLLDAGRVVVQDKPKQVVTRYLEQLFGPEPGRPSAGKAATVRPAPEGGSPEPEADRCRLRPGYNASEYRWGDGRAAIADCVFYRDGVEIGNRCRSGERVTVEMLVHFREDLSNLIYGLTWKTPAGVDIYGLNSRQARMAPRNRRAGEWARVRFELTVAVLPGDYFMSLGVAVDDPGRDNLAIDRRYDLMHVVVEGELDAFGLAQFSASMSEPDNQAAA
jgi:lipopolysaccharide transport system ATP-binding protein